MTETDLDELREHGRHVLERVRTSQKRALAASIPDRRTDKEIREAYASAMAAKRKPVERDGHGDSQRDRDLREKRYQAERGK